MIEQVEISQGVFVIGLEKFIEVYEARKDSISVLSSGVKERMDLYLTKISAIKENEVKS